MKLGIIRASKFYKSLSVCCQHPAQCLYSIIGRFYLFDRDSYTPARGEGEGEGVPVAPITG